MDLRLHFSGPQAGQCVRIQIAQAEQRLEKEHGGGPDGGTATKPGQYLFAQQRLYLEQQKCAREYRQRKGQKTPGIGGVSLDSMDHGLSGNGNQGA